MISISIPLADAPFHKRATSLGVIVMCCCVVAVSCVWGMAIDVQRVLDGSGLTPYRLPTAELLRLEKATWIHTVAFYCFLGAYLALTAGASTWFGNAVDSWLTATREVCAAEAKPLTSTLLKRWRSWT